METVRIDDNDYRGTENSSLTSRQWYEVHCTAIKVLSILLFFSWSYIAVGWNRATT